MKRVDERGMALVLVLLFATVIAGLAANLLLGLRDSARLAHGTELLLVRRIAADSAIDIVAARLRDPAEEPFKEMAFEIGETRIKVTLEPASGRIDVNNATPEELETWIAKQLAEDFEAADDLALTLSHRIVDWRDADDLRQLEGAEADDYRRAGLDYAPADGPFRHVSELRDVMGMTDQIFQLLSSGAAVTTGSPPPSPATEDAETEETAAEETEDTETAATSDALNLYHITIDARSPDAGRLASAATIWIEAEGDTPFEILDYQPFMLTEEAE